MKEIINYANTYDVLQSFWRLVWYIGLFIYFSSNIDFLSSFKKLSTIILDHNHLTSDTIFPQNPNVTTLWLNHNFIETLYPFVHRVSKAYRNLKFLSLMGNTGAPSYLNGGTYYEYIQYR